jgi:hypothetical protein
MALGKTCVISDIRAHDFVDKDCSVKFSLDDPLNLANCLQELIEYPSRCLLIAKNARKKAKVDFSFNRTMNCHVELYQGELNG